MVTNRSKFEQLLETWEPRIRDAFLNAVAEIKDGVMLKRLVERLERGDVAGAIEVFQIDAEAFGRLEIEIANAYNAGGIDMASSLVLRDPDGSRVAFRFGVRNPEAEQSTDLIGWGISPSTPSSSSRLCRRPIRTFLRLLHRISTTTPHSRPRARLRSASAPVG